MRASEDQSKMAPKPVSVAVDRCKMGSNHILSAIGGNRRTRDKACIIGDQENNRSCDLFRLAQPANGDVRQNIFLDHSRINSFHHVRRDIAGAYRIDRDTDAGTFLGQSLHKTEIARF